MNRSLDLPQTVGRVSRAIVAIGLVGTGLAGLRGGWTLAAGFLIGSVAAYFNFRNLSRVVGNLGTANSSGSAGAIAWILFRLILLVAGAFVIIRLTSISILAVFVGLCVPVAAVILETIFELTYAR